MRILAIETSCDETAISIIEAKGGFDRPVFKVLAGKVASQIEIHKEWGGVVPSIAKREHGKAAIPLLESALKEAGLLKLVKKPITDKKLILKTAKLLEREAELVMSFLEFIPKISIPKIDAIAVTQGPGLEPALWVGINFARALSLFWNIPVIPTNHMEGHIYSSLASDESTKSKVESKKSNSKIQFPAVALLVSGGHTELVLIKDWLKYKVIGNTRDDAIGEAFDKVARLLDLPYPGGPEISRLADFKISNTNYKLPRPMIGSGDLDFSFSGLKTAVLYLVKKIAPLSEDDKKAIAFEFQNAALDVILKKTLVAVDTYQAQTLIVGGGVIANKKLKERLIEELADKFPDTNLLLPSNKFSTDNATMIAIAAYFQSLKKKFRVNPNIKADGNLGL
jgi:N6-L-threonylcarbamoyladenine synthase